MAKGDKGSKGNAATNVEPRHEEQQQAATDAPPVDIGAGVETTASDAPADEPGPEDFERHSGARLVGDHEADLALLRQIEDRVTRRENVIGTRLRAKGAHATIRIAGVEYTARVKPNSGGKMGIAKVGPRVEASID